MLFNGQCSPEQSFQVFEEGFRYEYNSSKVWYVLILGVDNVVVYMDTINNSNTT